MKISTNRKVEGTWKTDDGINKFVWMPMCV